MTWNMIVFYLAQEYDGSPITKESIEARFSSVKLYGDEPEMVRIAVELRVRALACTDDFNAQKLFAASRQMELALIEYRRATH